MLANVFVVTVFSLSWVVGMAIFAKYAHYIVIFVFHYRTMMGNIPVITVLFSLSWVVGMVIFANYANCDPLSLGYITKIDEVLPFYVEDKFANIPGLLGLFMASLFNGALRYV